MDQQLSQNPDADVEMSPMIEKRRGMVRRFWSSDEAQEEWKAYVGSIEDGCASKLYFATIIFTQQSEIYIEKLKEKQAKDAKKNEKKNGGTGQTTSETTKEGRKKRKGFYREESESDMSVDDSDEEEKQMKAGKSSRARRADRRKVPKSESSFDSDKEPEEEEDDDEDEEWDENCYKCGKEGEVICCESCPHVAHKKCVELRVVPTEDWYCEDCRFKQAN